MLLPIAAAYALTLYQNAACSTSDDSVVPGQSAYITCHCPTTPTWTSSAGSLANDRNSATLSTFSVRPGSTVVVTANCAGVKNPVSISIGAPEMAAPQALRLCTLSFDRDPKQPVRVDTQAKACLDEIALNLRRRAEATLLVVGSADAREANAPRRAQQRADNARDYLIQEQGIDASRILTATAGEQSKTVETLLLPPGLDTAAIIRGLPPIPPGPAAHKPSPRQKP
jgi:hypothetical protein